MTSVQLAVKDPFLPGVLTDTFQLATFFTLSNAADVRSLYLNDVVKTGYSDMKRRLISMDATFVINTRNDQEFISSVPTGGVVNLPYFTPVEGAFNNFSWMSAYLSGDSDDNPTINFRVLTNSEKQTFPQDWPFGDENPELNGFVAFKMTLRRT